MAENLFRLGKLLDSNLYSGMAENMLKQVYSQLIKGELYYSNWSKLAGNILNGTYEAAITGPDALKFNTDLQKHFLPNSIFMGSKERSNLPLLEEKYIEGKTFIYVCKNYTCDVPVETADEAFKLVLI